MNQYLIETLPAGIKGAFTRIELEPHSGAIARPGTNPGLLQRLRIWNFIEAIAAFSAVMAVVWCEYWLDRDATAQFRSGFGVPALLWMFVLSPLLHSRYEKGVFLTPDQEKRAAGLYFWELRGLGNPLRYYFGRDGAPPLLHRHWRVVLGMTAAVTLLFVCACITFHEEMIERGYAGDTLAATLGVRAGMILFIDALLVFILFPFMLRLDNFARALRFIFAFMISIFAIVLAFNLFFQFVMEPLRDALEGWYYIRLRGTPASERLSALADPLAIGGQWAGYVFWGWVQQFIFASYFAVLFGRAFDLGRRRGFFTACFFSALVFSLVHLPNVWLMFFTFIGGFAGTLYFYQCRNIFALGFVHGFGGSLLNKLTPINFSVGAGQMRP
jgi:membrane protease YdiL (CAAX protease family)